MLHQLTKREQEKLDIITECLQGRITKTQAALMLGISTRQVKRLKARVREIGAQAVVHQLKRKPSNHHVEDSIKEKVITVIAEKYSDFKPTFATEQLEENHGIHISL